MCLLETSLDFFSPTPCIWIFSMGRHYCESEGKCTGCQAHNGIILLFQYVCVSLCKEEVVGTEWRPSLQGGRRVQWHSAGQHCGEMWLCQCHPAPSARLWWVLPGTHTITLHLPGKWVKLAKPFALLPVNHIRQNIRKLQFSRAFPKLSKE